MTHTLSHHTGLVRSLIRLIIMTVTMITAVSTQARPRAFDLPDTDSVGSVLPKSPNQYRVGLVLSGGGAKGIAHVGVIQALEESGIAIDCIAGTSMGAVVGSLYACGYSPAEMMTLFKSPGFLNSSTGTISPNEVYYYTKPNPTPGWATVNINFNDTTSNVAWQLIPTNLISPLPMNIQFLEMYAPFSQQCKENFDNLFVPLRTVCSDIYHKHKVVSSSGSLGDAVRASMSFPLVFKPIELDGVLMYDGGIYDNFPVNVMQSNFNPNFMIGVSVAAADGKPSSGNIYSQLEDMIVQNNDYTLPDSLGIKIQVPVLNFGVLDFGQANTIYNIGYQTGKAMVDSIKARCPARRSPQEVAVRRARFKQQTPTVMFDSISVQGTTHAQEHFIRSLFFGGKHHKQIGLPQVTNAYFRSVTDGKFSDLLPQYLMGEDGKNTLLLKAQVKKPWVFGVGGWLTSSTHSMLYLTAGYHTLSFNSLNADVNLWIGQSYSAAEGSARFSLATERPSYLQLTGVLSQLKYYDSELLFYQTKTPSFITRNENYAKFSYGMAAGKRSKFVSSIGFSYTSDHYFPTNSGDYADMTKDLSRYQTSMVQALYEYNTLGNQLYPMSGSQFEVSAAGAIERSKYITAEKARSIEKYTTHYGILMDMKWKHFFKLHHNIILGTATEAVATIRPLYQNYVATLVHSPGFAPTPSTQDYFYPAFRSDNYVAAGLIPIWNPVSKIQLRGDIYAFSPMRDLKAIDTDLCVYDGWFKRVEFIGEIAAVYNFPFSSLAIYANYLSEPHNNWNFGISFGLLFKAPKFIR